MPVIVTVPCLADNYAFLLHDPATGATACIDVPEAAPILAVLDARGWTLGDVILTHHHSDHVDGPPTCWPALPPVSGAQRQTHTACHRWIMPLLRAIPFRSGR